jgi:hypothetical protein
VGSAAALWFRWRYWAEGSQEGEKSRVNGEKWETRHVGGRSEKHFGEKNKKQKEMIGAIIIITYVDKPTLRVG